MNKQWKEFVSNMRFSYSNLNSFYTCPYCWFKNYAEGCRDSYSNAFSEYGTMMHEVFELLDKELIDKDRAKTMAMGRMEDIDLPMAFGHDLNTSYRKASMTAIDNYETKEKIIALEKRVYFKIEDYEFTGFIDQVLEDDSGEYIIVDHKSKSNFKSKKEQKEYARQLYLYSIPLYETFGKYPKELRFNMFRKQKVVSIPFCQEELQEAIDWALGVIEDIKNAKEFPVTQDDFFKTELCNYRYDEGHIDNETIYLEDYRMKTVWIA